MNVLFFGDVVGKVGRRALQSVLPRLIEREGADFVIANCENVSGGAGVDEKSCEALLEAGVDALTSGNHIWRRKEIGTYLERDGVPLLRPANFPGEAPGRGWDVFTTAGGERVAVVNLIGRVFMASVDCPFQAAEDILDEIGQQARIVFVDMHCRRDVGKGRHGLVSRRPGERRRRFSHAHPDGGRTRTAAGDGLPLRRPACAGRPSR